MIQLIDAAEPLLRDSANTLPESIRNVLLGLIGVQWSISLYWQGDAEGCLRHARRALHDVPGRTGYLYGCATLYSGGALALLGRKDEALQLLEDALEEYVAEGSRNVGAFLMWQQVAHYYAGNFKAVRHTSEQMLAIHESVPMLDYWYGLTQYFLGYVGYEFNPLDEAMDHFQHAERLRYRMGVPAYHAVLLGLATVAWVRGELELAEHYAHAARSFAIEVNAPYSLKISDSLETRLAVLSGEMPVESKPYTAVADAVQFWIEIPSLTHAEYLVSRGSPEDCDAALAVVEDGLQQAQQHHKTRQAIQFLAFKAVALKCSGRLEEAIDFLAETLRMAEPLGFVRTFVDRGRHMADLLNTMATWKSDAKLQH